MGWITVKDSYLEPLRAKSLCVCVKFLGGEFGFIHPRVDLLFEFIEAAPQGRWEGRVSRQQQAQTGAQNPCVGAGAEHGDTEA